MNHSSHSDETLLLSHQPNAFSMEKEDISATISTIAMARTDDKTLNDSPSSPTKKCSSHLGCNYNTLPYLTTDSDGKYKTITQNSTFLLEIDPSKLRSSLKPFLDGGTENKRSIWIGLTLISLLGILLGIIMPKNQALPTPCYRYFSSMIGYTYFIFWCFSFYPQIISNYMRKSTDGLSVDFSVINFLGYICYSIYTSLLYWNPDIKVMYQERHNKNIQYVNLEHDEELYQQDATITVQSNDVAFAFHAVVFSGIWLYQLYIYGSLRCKDGKLALSKTFSVLIGAILSLVMVYCFLVWKVSKWNIIPKDDSWKNEADLFLEQHDHAVIPSWLMRHLNWLDFLYFLSFVKVFITLLKYIPQVLLNSRRRSCVGWNIWNVILDIAGAILSFIQLIGDAIDLEDYSSITGNMGKLGLSIISLGFDVIFLLQHYVWYRNSEYESLTGEEYEL